MKQTEILTHATHVNGWFPAVYMSCMSQNFRLFHVSNLSVRNFRIFLLMYTGSLRAGLTSHPARDARAIGTRAAAVTPGRSAGLPADQLIHPGPGEVIPGYREPRIPESRASADPVTKPRPGRAAHFRCGAESDLPRRRTDTARRVPPCDVTYPGQHVTQVTVNTECRP